MQAPGRPDEDRRGGFDRGGFDRGGFGHGGWMLPYADAVQGANASRSMAETEALLFGRRT